MFDPFEKLVKFRDLVEKERKERLIKDRLNCEANIKNCEVKIIPGRKYMKINIGLSGAFMVDKQDNIFGIKGYGQVHKGHYYGTLDTIDQWYWGNYSPTKKA